MSAVQAPEARPLGNTTEALEVAQLDQQQSSNPLNGGIQTPSNAPDLQPPDEKPDAWYSSLPALASCVAQASCDDVPTGFSDLPLEKGDLVGCLGAVESGSSVDSNFFWGTLLSGKNKGHYGIYDRNDVSNIDPTDPAFHDALTAISGSGNLDKLAFLEKASGSAQALFRTAPLDHIRPDSNDSLVTSKRREDRAGDNEPTALGSIARQDSNIRPDLLLPGSLSIPEEFNTAEKILGDNPNYGSKTRPYVPSQSVFSNQRRENRRPTPPMPRAKPKALHSNANSQPKSPPYSADDLTDIEARFRQLRSQLFDAGKGDLFYTLTRSQDPTPLKTAVLSFAALQHMALHQLQYDISCYVGLMYRTSHFYMELQGFPPLVELMNNYCNAIRNLDYMKQCAARGYEEDPFLMKSSRAPERSILETTKMIPNHILPAGPLPQAKDDDNAQLRDMGRNEANRVAPERKRLLRFGMAGLGGLLLVVPMLIMANVPGKQQV